MASGWQHLWVQTLYSLPHELVHCSLQRCARVERGRWKPCPYPSLSLGSLISRVGEGGS